MSCDPPKKDNSKHKLLHKNASSLVTIMNNIYYLYPAFWNVCIIGSYHSNERLVMFLPNIYPGLL